jgi:hypothetical protein
VLWSLAACDQDDPDRPIVSVGMMDATMSEAGSSEAGVVDDCKSDDASCHRTEGASDCDHDGFSPDEGDCDDCNIARGPGAYDLPQNGVDEDCTGGDAQETLAACDARLDAVGADHGEAAKAVGLCAREVNRASRRWGLIDSRWLRLSGDETLLDTRQVWFPEHFGAAKAREGSRLLVMSTGVARDVDAEGYTDQCDVLGSTLDMTGAWTGGVAPPKGFPRDSSLCDTRDVSKGARAYNDVGLELTLRAPTNATGLAFESIFYTYEYPDFVCTRYNDFFVVLMDPAPHDFQQDDNVLFDDNGQPIGVNTGFLSVCRSTSRASENRSKNYPCPGGVSLLAKTGFDAKEASCAPLPKGATDLGGASTGWLRTELPVVAGSVFKLRFVLWDSGDPLLDSTVALDHLRFVFADPDAPTVVGTKPIAFD